MADFFSSLRDSIGGLFHRFSERRQHPRKKKVYLADVESRGRRIPATIVNLSRQGIGISSEQKFSKDADIVVIFSHEFSTGKHKGMKIALKLPGKVVWSKALPADASAQHGSPAGSGAEFDTGIIIGEIPAEISALYNTLLDELTA
jgi:hypothetical protein